MPQRVVSPRVVFTPDGGGPPFMLGPDDQTFYPLARHQGLEARPEDYRVDADGADWIPAIERAQAAAEVVSYTPGKEYLISRGIRPVSGKKHRGNRAVLKNMRTHAKSPYHAAFLLGNIHPAMFKYSPTTADHLPVHDCATIAVGHRDINLSVVGNSAAYAVGQWCVVRTRGELFTSGAYYPHWAQFAKVAASSAGVVTLDRPVLDAIASACISPIGSTTDTYTGTPWAFIEGVEISDFLIDAPDVCSTRSGASRCEIRGINLKNADQAFAVNAFLNCSVSDVQGPVTDRMIELKCYSTGNRFSRFSGHLGASGTLPPIDIAEQSSRNILEQIVFVVPSSNGNDIECARIGGRWNVVQDSDLYHLGGAGAPVAAMFGENFVGYGPRGNKLVNTRLTAGAARTHHIIVGGGPEAAEQPTHYTLQGVETFGVTTSSKSLKVAYGGQGGKLVGCSLSYGHEIVTGATAPSEAAVSIA